MGMFLILFFLFFMETARFGGAVEYTNNTAEG